MRKSGQSLLNRPPSMIVRVALAVLLFRAFIPSGFMPAPVGSGWPLQLCPNGLNTAAIETLFKHHDHHHASDPGTGIDHIEQCQFGLQLGAAYLPGDGWLLADPVSAPLLVKPFIGYAVARRHYNYYSRAPPRSSPV